MKHTSLIPAVVIALATAACGPPPAPGTAPPPGKSYADYLAPPDRATDSTRPSDTDDNDAMVVHSIDIGQGAATLVEFPCGAMLIDTGGEENPLYDSWPDLRSYLDGFFKRRGDLKNTFDLMVITHPHLDHTRNIAAVLKRYRVRNVIDNGAISGDIGIDQQVVMHAWLDRNRARVGHRDINAGDVSPDGLTGPVIDPIGGCARAPTDPVITALWGGKESEEVGDNANDHSVVLRVDYGKSSALLSGDIERLSIARIARKFADNPALLDVDIYYVPHHGSRNSTAAHLIKSVSPKIALISMGPYERLHTFTARRFGHPHQAAIGHLLDPEHGVSQRRSKPIDVQVGLRGGWKERPSEFEKRTIHRAVYATGWDGNIRVRANANGWLDVDVDGRPPLDAKSTAR